MQQEYQGVSVSNSIPKDINVMSYSVGDILYSNIRPYLRKVWLAINNGGCSADVFVVHPNDSYIHSAFLYYCIANDKFVSYVMSGAKGVKMPRGDKEQILDYPLHIPTHSEQMKIANLISLIDERITTQNKIIEDLEVLIKGVSDIHIRRKIGNIHLKDCVFCHSSSLAENSIQYDDGGYPVYGATGLLGYTSNYEVEKESILIVKDGAGVGRVRYVEGKFSVLGTLNYLTVQNEMPLKYIYYCLRTFDFSKHIVGSGIPHIYFKNYGKDKIYVPSETEYLRVERLLSLLDEKIECEHTIQENLLSQKKHLLSNMFI